jgi:hypothetical protein
MSNQPTMIQSTAMPTQVLPTMPPGSKGIMDAGVKQQQIQTQSQMALIGKTGGSKQMKGGKHRAYMMGGNAPVVQVPPVPSGTVNPQATGVNYKGLTELAQQQAGQAVYDTAKTPAQTASIAAQQQAVYNGKTGGSRKYKRGGSWPKWGCLSGGKKSRRKSRKSCKRGVKRNKKTKRHHH